MAIHSRLLQIPPGSSGLSNWFVLPVGAGANITGVSISNDNTIVIRTDTAGGFIWLPNGTSPVGTTGTFRRAQGASNYSPPLGPNYNSGVFEFVVAPSNSAMMYATSPAWSNTGANLLLSVYSGAYNSGTGIVTWTRTAFPSYMNTNPANTFPQKNFSQKMAVDPNNTSNVLVGQQNDGFLATNGTTSTSSAVLNFANTTSLSPGLGIGGWAYDITTSTYLGVIASFSSTTVTLVSNSLGTVGSADHIAFGGAGLLQYSSNAGSSWTTTGVPASTTAAGILCLQYNPQDSNTIFCSSDGNGIYKTSTGALGTWNKINASSGPTTGNGSFTSSMDGAVGASNGNYYVIEENTGILWRYSGSTWTNILGSINGSKVTGVAADPQLSGHIVATNTNGSVRESFDGGSTFGSLTPTGPGNPTLTGSGDVPWIADTSAGIGLGLFGNIMFDALNAKRIYGVGNQGFWTMSWTGSLSAQSITWQAQSRGIEELVGNDIIVPTSGNAVTAAWDFGTHYKASNTYITTPAFSTVPNSNQNYPGFAGFGASWSIDYAVGTNSVAIINDGFYGPGGTSDQFSTDGGNTWTAYTPPNTNSGGSISMSTATHVLLSRVNQSPFWTANFGASPTWTAASFNGGSFSGLGENTLGIGYRWTAADRVHTDFYTVMFNSTGFFTTNDGGTTWVPYANTTAGKGNAGTQATNSQIKAPPGQGYHLWWTGGTWGQNYVQPPTNVHNTSFKALQYSTTANSDLTATGWTQVTNVTYCGAVGFGASAPGQSYPAVYIANAWVQDTSTTAANFATGIQTWTLAGGANTPSVGAAVTVTSSTNQMVGVVTAWNAGTKQISININYVASGAGSSSSWKIEVFGIWRNITGPSATPAWTQLGVWPNDNFDPPTNISGDAANYGYVYISHGGSGFAWGSFP